jgi:hypothetical protein
MTAEPGAADAPLGAQASNPAAHAPITSDRAGAGRLGDKARMVCLS